MKVQSVQLEGLRQVAEASYVASLTTHAAEHFPTIHAVAGAAGIERAAREAIARGRAHDFTGAATLRCWFECSLLLGMRFDEDPGYAFLATRWDWEAEKIRISQPEDGPATGVLSMTGEPQQLDMADDLHDDVWAHVEKVEGEGHAESYRAVARSQALLRRGEDGTRPIDAVRSGAEMLALCARLHPKKAEALGAEPLQALLSAAGRHAAADGFEGAGLLVYAMDAFLGGVGFYRDPALGIAGRTIEEMVPLPGDAAPETRCEALIAATAEQKALLLDAARADAVFAAARSGAQDGPAEAAPPPHDGEAR